jgi:hypothetical protein
MTVSADLTETTSFATPKQCGRRRHNLHSSQKSSFNTETPTSSTFILNTTTPTAPHTPADQASLNELMLLSHLREYEHRARYLEHEAYINNLRYSSCRKMKVKLVKEGLWQNREITGLSQENDQLRMEKDEMAEDLRQTRNYFRATAFEATEFLERKR